MSTSGKIRMGGLFAKTFALLMAASVALLLVYNLVFVGLVRDTYEKTMTDINTDLVSKTSFSMDMLLSNIAKEALVVSQNRDVLHALLVPSFDHNRRNAAISEALTNIARENPLIHAVSIHVLSHDLVFYSDGQIGRSGTVRTNGEIEFAKNHIDRSGFYVRPSERVGKPFLTYYLNFPDGKELYMGRIAVDIDSDFLYANLTMHGTGGVDDDLIVVDGAGAIIAGSPNAPPPAGGFGNLGREPLGHFVQTIDGVDYSFFHCLSTLTGWRVIRIQRSSRSLLLEKIFTSIFLPMTALYLVFSACIAWYFSRRVSRPVASLVKQVVGQDNFPSPDAYRNEYELIGDGLSRFKRERSEMALTVANSTPYIVDDYLRNILQGKMADTKEISFYSRYLDVSFYAEAKYLVGVFQPRPFSAFAGDPEEAGPGEVDKLADSIRLGGLPENCHLFTTMDLTKIIILAVFPQALSEPEANSAGQESVARLLGVVPNHQPHDFVVGISQVYIGAANARHALNEAMNALKYKLYLGAENDIDSKEISQIGRENRTFEISRFYAEDIKRIVNAVSAGDQALAEENLAVLVQNLRESMPLEDRYIGYVFMRLIESLVQYAADRGIHDVLPGDRKAYRELSRLPTFAEQARLAGDICARVSEKVRERITSRYNKYVIAAKSHIAENYANSDMSLNSIAAAIGINGTYLSRLFKQETGESCLDYLNRYRVDKAKEMLQTSTVAVKVVGYLVGFYSIQSFIRTFKKLEGITPGKYGNRLDTGE